MPILTKKFLVENDKNDKEQVVVTPAVLDKEIDSELSPNVTIEDQSQVPKIKSPVNGMKLTKTEIEELEDKINTNSTLVDDVITETFYELNRDIMLAQSILESISISAIHEQYKILTECTYDSEEYHENIETLTEATGIAIIDKLIAFIKDFISKAKDFLNKLGVTISVSLVDYEKWADSKESDLIEKASKYGSEVNVKVHNWDDNLLFDNLPLSAIESVAEDICPTTSNKDKMKEIVEKVMNKYDTADKAGADAYTHALAIALGGDPDDRILDDKSMAINAARLKIMGKEKDKYMESKRTSDYLIKLRKVKSKSSKCLSNMRTNGINSHFDQLIKDAQYLPGLLRCIWLKQN